MYVVAVSKLEFHPTTHFLRNIEFMSHRLELRRALLPLILPS